MRIQRTVHTARDPESAFAMLSDFTTTTEWDPGTVTTTKTAGEGGVGTIYHNVSQFNGRETELIYTVVDFDPPRRIHLHGENKTVSAEDVITVQPHGDGSTVTYTADFTFKGLAKLAQPFLRGAFTKLGDEAEVGLRRYLQA